MKLSSVVHKVETNIDSDEKVFSFNEKNSAKLALILSSNLYSDKVGSIIRELCMNAYDAHVAAGTLDKPFKVVLPTQFQPTFTIEDYGTGLSYDDMLDLYTSYGESTKNTSNKFIGAFGLGSKSPFAYSSSFIVSSRYNGKKHAFQAYLNDQRMPTLKHLSTVDTLESNGLTIEIPVKQNDFYSFSTKFNEFYSNFLYPIKNNSTKEKENVLNIVKDQILYEKKGSDGTTFSNGIFFVQNGPYLYKAYLNKFENFDQIDLSYINKIKRHIQELVIFDANIGEYDLTASRESFDYSQKTLKFFKRKFSLLEEKFKKRIEKLERKDKETFKEYVNRVKTFSNEEEKLFQLLTSSTISEKIDINEDLHYIVHFDNGYYGINLITKPVYSTANSLKVDEMSSYVTSGRFEPKKAHNLFNMSFYHVRNVEKENEINNLIKRIQKKARDLESPIMFEKTSFPKEVVDYLKEFSFITFYTEEELKVLDKEFTEKLKQKFKKSENKIEYVTKQYKSGWNTLFNVENLNQLKSGDYFLYTKNGSIILDGKPLKSVCKQDFLNSLNVVPSIYLIPVSKSDIVDEYNLVDFSSNLKQLIVKAGLIYANRKYYNTNGKYTKTLVLQKLYKRKLHEHLRNYVEIKNSLASFVDQVPLLKNVIENRLKRLDRWHTIWYDKLVKYVNENATDVLSIMLKESRTFECMTVLEMFSSSKEFIKKVKES